MEKGVSDGRASAGAVRVRTRAGWNAQNHQSIHLFTFLVSGLYCGLAQAAWLVARLAAWLDAWLAACGWLRVASALSLSLT